VPPELNIEPAKARRLEEAARSTVAAEEDDLDKVDFSGTADAAKTGKINVCPKPFQRLAIPYALSGANMIVASETGSGKTLVFLMAVFMNAFPAAAEAKPTGVRALVIVPNGHRDLVDQHAATFRRVARRLKATGDPFWGGVANTDEAVSCTTWRAGFGKKADDRRHPFPNALIRIDTEDRILISARSNGHAPRSFCSQVKVIAIDEVDKYLLENDKKHKDSVEEILEVCKEAQIISTSATVVRHSELKNAGVRDGVADWLGGRTPDGNWHNRFQTYRPGAGPPRPLISVQTENVMPFSVFHLIVDLRVGGRRSTESTEIQLAWERLLTCRDKDAMKRGVLHANACLVLYNDNKRMAEKKHGVGLCFPDKQDKDQKTNIDSLAKGTTLDARRQTMVDLKEQRLTGILGTNALATGIDFPFASVSLSRLHPTHLRWDSYVHASGRCGRRPNQLGLSIIYIHNDVRQFIFLVSLFCP
jgi:superfamily II DNA/RNA helicase